MRSEGSEMATRVAAVLLHQRAGQFRQMRIIACGQGGQAHFLIARVGQQLARQLQQVRHAALALRAIENARLTEAAAAGTAAGDFQHHAVMNDLGERHNDLVRVFRLIQVGDAALADLFRHIVAQAIELP